MNSHKIIKIMSTIYFETPLTAKSSPPQSIKNLPHAVKLFLWEKSPTHNNVAPKLNA